MADDIKIFADRGQFRKWLGYNCRANDGVWLLFGKSGGPKTIKAEAAFMDSGPAQQKFKTEVTREWRI